MAVIDDRAVERLVDRARREIDEGLLPSCQLAVLVDGEPVVETTLGDAPPDARYVIFSATKALVAATFWTLLDEGSVRLEDPVRRWVGELMADGDPERGSRITVAHLLTHTSGFPHAPLGPPDWFDRAGRLRRMARWRCSWEPGTRYEYHPTSAHWVLAEIIERVTGTDHRQAVRERVLDPHGLDRIELGVPAERQGDVQRLVAVGEPPSPEEIREVLGIDALPVTEVTEDALLGFNDPAVRALGVPGGGAVSDAASMARFYECLMTNPAGVWSDRALAALTAEVHNRFPDPLTGVPVLRTLGLCTAGGDGRSHLRGFGRTVSARAFGHNGAGGQICWADPERRLAFAYLTNGLDAHTFRLARRGTALSSLAAACVAV